MTESERDTILIHLVGRILRIESEVLALAAERFDRVSYQDYLKDAETIRRSIAALYAQKSSGSLAELYEELTRSEEE